MATKLIRNEVYKSSGIPMAYGRTVSRSAKGDKAGKHLTQRPVSIVQNVENKKFLALQNDSR